MEYAKLNGLSCEVSRIGLGTWSIGGFMWGGTDEHEALETIRTALECGINLLDTAPAYGFGRAEELVVEPWRNIAGGRKSSSRPRSDWSGVETNYFAMRQEADS